MSTSISGHAPGVASTSGAVLWARYSYPPNELGYCGPADHPALLQYGASRTVDAGLRQLLRGFEGAYPYIQLIAGATGIGDEFDARVVEAYWLGSPLLERIDMTVFGDSLRERFRHRAGDRWGYLAEAIPEGARPTHAFHVFGVYPWVGRLRGDRSGIALEVLDRCRIRWGKVRAVHGDQVVVEYRPLQWDGHALSLGARTTESATRAVVGVGFTADLAAGDWVSLHWGWVCDRLAPRQLANLRRSTRAQLEITNHRVAHSGPGMRLTQTEREF